jgi:hypothetical protein
MATPNLGLEKPADNDITWGDDYRAAMDTLDANPGTAQVADEAARVALEAASWEGRLVYQKDTDILYKYEGSSVWSEAGSVEVFTESAHDLHDHAGVAGVPAEEAFTEAVHASTDHAGITGCSGGGSGGGAADRIWVPAGTPSVFDDEFNDGTIDANWVAVDTPGYTNSWYEPAGLHGISANVPSGKGAHKTNGLLKAFTGLTPPFYIETAVRGFSRSQGFPTLGLIFADGATYGAGSQIIAGPVINNNTIIKALMTGYNARSSFTEAAWLANAIIPWMHIRFVYESANTFRVLCSADGVVWIDFYGTFSYTITPTHFGIIESTFDNSSLPFACQWQYFRVREGLSENG